MTDIIDVLLTVAFYSVRLMVGSDLISRYGREAKLRAAMDRRASNGSLFF